MLLAKAVPVRPNLIIIALALLATGLKLYCAWTTIGTNDVMLNFSYGHKIAEDGLVAMYRATPLFNHTPLIGSLVASAFAAGGESGARFPFFLRLPGILADFISVLILLRIQAKTGAKFWWGLALLAASPVSLMVSGFHGNVDPLLVMFLLAAACACVEDEAALCGLFLGLACNVKIIALLFSPIFFFYWLHRRRAWSFTGLVAVAVLVGWSVPLLSVPETFLKNVLGYNSYWGIWGITYWLRETHWSQAQAISFIQLTPAQQAIMTGLKLIIVAGVLTLAWRRRACSAAELLVSMALAWILFFALAPGVCAQYMVWLAPFVLIYSTRWYAALTAASSLFLFFFYTVISRGIPWNYGDSTGDVTPYWVAWTNWPWAVLVACLICSWRKFLSAETAMPVLVAEKLPSDAALPVPALTPARVS